MNLLSFRSLFVGAASLTLLFTVTTATARAEKPAPFAQWQEAQTPDVTQLAPLNPDDRLLPGTTWWDQFHDPLLNQYVTQALKANPDLAAAGARITEARALVDEARARLKPTASIGANYLRFRNSENAPLAGNVGAGTTVPGQQRGPLGQTFNLFTLPLQASYEVDLFGKNRLLVRSAQKNQDIAAMQHRNLEAVVASEVAGSYFNLLTSDAALANNQNLINTLNEVIGLRRQLYLGGVLPFDTVLLTEEDLAAANEQRAQYLNQRAVYAHQLSVLLGTPPESEDHVNRQTLDQILLPESLVTGVPSSLLTRRPDVVAAELRMERADIDVKQARRLFYPSLTLNGQLGFSSKALGSLFDWRSHLLQLGGGLLQSLYTGGYRRANVRYQEAVAEEVVDNYSSTLLVAFREVEDSLAGLKADAGEYRLNLQEIKTAQTFTNLTENRFKGGVGNKIDFLDARRQLLTYQLLAAQNKGRSLIDTVSLYKALGGGTITP